MRLRLFALQCLALLSFSSILFSGCSTDLDPNADYKEVMVIYKIRTTAANHAKMKKAVDLSQEKYCGVSAMFRAFCKLEYKIEYL